jgi:hypothetical protein
MQIAIFVDSKDEFISYFQQQVLTHRNENIIIDN